MKRLTNVTSLPILPRLAASNQYGKATKMRAKMVYKIFQINPTMPNFICQMIMLELEQTSAVHLDTYGFKQTLTIF